MNGQMGAVYMAAQKWNLDSPALQYVKETDLICPVPANAWVFADECPYTIGDGYLEVDTHAAASFPMFPPRILGILAVFPSRTVMLKFTHGKQQCS